MKQKLFSLIFSAMLFSALLIACKNNQESSADSGRGKTVAPEFVNNEPLIQERLRRFDSLDFQFYNNQQWDSFAISHDDNIKVYYPDGSITTGLYPQHIDMLTHLFAFAPDTKIYAHPIKFGSGDYTAVIGEMEGTFSRPMPLGNGQSIAPTGKKFKLRMATIGIWKEGKMVEEHLFWDNLSLLK